MSENIIILLSFIAIIVGATLLFQKIINSIRSKPLLKSKALLSLEVDGLQKKIEQLTNQHDALDAETKDLQQLRDNGEQLARDVDEKRILLEGINKKIDSLSDKEAEADKVIHDIRSKIDLYSRLDDFVDYGMYEMPQYLYETSERYALEIKKIREEQKELIRSQNVIISYDNDDYDLDLSFIKKIVVAQKKLVIRSFNIECDLLIGKLNPANVERTLERIEAIANDLEKDFADMRYGFNEQYISLKFEECRLQYEFLMKKKEEQEEQRAIREQMKEEERARREYEAAIAKAQKARQALAQTSDADRQAAELRIQQLEEELAEAKAKAERAMSMAQQTKKGHVYVISNIGSFGENVYKIGLTRRLDPTERVRELGDASVPFSFDIHAMISSEDAPSLETALHRAFDDKRVNAVNMRKEFFKVGLEDIRKKVEEITGNEADFVTTILAEEYFQTKRLRHVAA
ncbi:DUF4041 domain-containing protein [Bilophila wadsworthia]|uniref:DUF4041 domain-containing protein n=1 Tax=Bilophila wadsworthia TaxID=35833 RepID=UPI0026DBB56C|nr:DUF4041 domain-containing protein [Bilophila wadsworthia]